MGTDTEKVETLNERHRKNKRRSVETNDEFYKKMFETNWEVLVVKKDKLTGQMIWTTDCNALAPV